MYWAKCDLPFCYHFPFQYELLDDPFSANIQWSKCMAAIMGTWFWKHQWVLWPHLILPKSCWSQ